MSKKENFGKAMFDMFGVGEDGPQPAQPAQPEERPAAGGDHEPDAVQKDAGQKRAPAATTILAEGTTIEGTLTAQGDVDLACTFQGEIRAEGNVILRTALNGNVHGATVELISCAVEGDIHAAVCVRLDERSRVKGNIYTNDLHSAGTIVGNVEAKGHVALHGSASLEGDLRAGTIAVEEGVAIHGGLQIPQRKSV